MDQPCVESRIFIAFPRLFSNVIGMRRRQPIDLYRVTAEHICSSAYCTHPAALSAETLRG